MNNIQKNNQVHHSIPSEHHAKKPQNTEFKTLRHTVAEIHHSLKRNVATDPAVLETIENQLSDCIKEYHILYTKINLNKKPIATFRELRKLYASLASILQLLTENQSASIFLPRLKQVLQKNLMLYNLQFEIIKSLHKLDTQQPNNIEKKLVQYIKTYHQLYLKSELDLLTSTVLQQTYKSLINTIDLLAAQHQPNNNFSISNLRKILINNQAFYDLLLKAELSYRLSDMQPKRIENELAQCIEKYQLLYQTDARFRKEQIPIVQQIHLRLTNTITRLTKAEQPAAADFRNALQENQELNGLRRRTDKLFYKPYKSQNDLKHITSFINKYHTLCQVQQLNPKQLYSFKYIYQTLLKTIKQLNQAQQKLNSPNMLEQIALLKNEVFNNLKLTATNIYNNVITAEFDNIETKFAEYLTRYYLIYQYKILDRTQLDSLHEIYQDLTAAIAASQASPLFRLQLKVAKILYNIQHPQLVDIAETFTELQQCLEATNKYLKNQAQLQPAEQLNQVLVIVQPIYSSLAIAAVKLTGHHNQLSQEENLTNAEHHKISDPHNSQTTTEEPPLQLLKTPKPKKPELHIIHRKAQVNSKMDRKLADLKRISDEILNSIKNKQIKGIDDKINQCSNEYSKLRRINHLNLQQKRILNVIGSTLNTAEHKLKLKPGLLMRLKTRLKTVANKFAALFSKSTLKEHKQPMITTMPESTNNETTQEQEITKELLKLKQTIAAEEQCLANEPPIEFEPAIPEANISLSIANLNFLLQPSLAKEISQAGTYILQVQTFPTDTLQLINQDINKETAFYQFLTAACAKVKNFKEPSTLLVPILEITSNDNRSVNEGHFLYATIQISDHHITKVALWDSRSSQENTALSILDNIKITLADITDYSNITLANADEQKDHYSCGDRIARQILSLSQANNLYTGTNDPISLRKETQQIAKTLAQLNTAQTVSKDAPLVPADESSSQRPSSENLIITNTEDRIIRLNQNQVDHASVTSEQTDPLSDISAENTEPTISNLNTAITGNPDSVIEEYSQPITTKDYETAASETDSELASIDSSLEDHKEIRFNTTPLSPQSLASSNEVSNQTSATDDLDLLPQPKAVSSLLSQEEPIKPSPSSIAEQVAASNDAAVQSSELPINHALNTSSASDVNEVKISDILTSAEQKIKDLQLAINRITQDVETFIDQTNAKPFTKLDAELSQGIELLATIKQEQTELNKTIEYFTDLIQNSATQYNQKLIELQESATEYSETLRSYELIAETRLKTIIQKQIEQIETKLNHFKNQQLIISTTIAALEHDANSLASKLAKISQLTAQKNFSQEQTKLKQLAEQLDNTLAKNKELLNTRLNDFITSISHRNDELTQQVAEIKADTSRLLNEYQSYPTPYLCGQNITNQLKTIKAAHYDIEYLINELSNLKEPSYASKYNILAKNLTDLDKRLNTAKNNTLITQFYLAKPLIEAFLSKDSVYKKWRQTNLTQKNRILYSMEKQITKLDSAQDNIISELKLAIADAQNNKFTALITLRDKLKAQATPSSTAIHKILADNIEAMPISIALSYFERKLSTLEKDKNFKNGFKNIIEKDDVNAVANYLQKYSEFTQLLKNDFASLNLLVKNYQTEQDFNTFTKLNRTEVLANTPDPVLHRAKSFYRANAFAWHLFDKAAKDEDASTEQERDAILNQIIEKYQAGEVDQYLDEQNAKDLNYYSLKEHKKDREKLKQLSLEAGRPNNTAPSPN